MSDQTRVSQPAEGPAPTSAPRADFGFLLSACLGALLLVCGSTIIYIDFRLARNHFRPGGFSVKIEAMGIALITLALLSRIMGRVHKAVVIIRNLLAGLVAILLLAFGLLLLIGPLH